jgi:hypothetical protein
MHAFVVDSLRSARQNHATCRLQGHCTAVGAQRSQPHPAMWCTQRCGCLLARAVPLVTCLGLLCQSIGCVSQNFRACSPVPLYLASAAARWCVVPSGLYMRVVELVLSFRVIYQQRCPFSRQVLHSPSPGCLRLNREYMETSRPLRGTVRFQPA